MKKITNPATSQRPSTNVVVMLLSLAFIVGMLLGRFAWQPSEKPCTTADCVRSRYGYSDSLDVSDYSRSRWIYTNATLLHAMQFRHGGFHFSYIDNEYPYMYTIDFANNTRAGHTPALGNLILRSDRAGSTAFGCI